MVAPVYREETNIHPFLQGIEKVFEILKWPFLDPFPNNMGIFRFNSGNNRFKNYGELIGKIVEKSTINYRK